MIVEVTDPFKFGKCCLNEATTLQGIIADYYKAVKPFLNSILSEIFKNEMYGKEVEALYNIGNDFHYLLTYLLMIANEQNNDAQWDLAFGTGCGKDMGMTYYTEKYNLNCIQKHFFCTAGGFDIGSALTIFGLNPDFVDQDGIGHMYIDFTLKSTCGESLKPFQVK
jgi:hypothetical protein